MDKFLKPPVFIAGCCAAIFTWFSLASAQAEDYSTWPNSQKIVINTSATGAGTTQNLINFPVLVRLNYQNFPGITKTLSGGADIRFAKPNGAHLSYEIERWVGGVNTKDVAEIWVKLDTVYGNNSTQSFIMYWGKAGVATTSSGPAVFDTANGFQGVWHLNDTAADATINHFNGTAKVAPADTVGLIGKAKIFNGTSTYYDVVNSATGKLNFPQHGTYTISAWANANVINSDFHSICDKGDYQYSLSINNNNYWEISEYQDAPPDAAPGWERTISPATANAWTYVTGIRNGAAAQSLYLNGVLKSSALQLIPADPVGTTRKTTNDFGIGRLTDTAATQASHFFNGKIDEVRIESVARSPDWVKLSYESQKSGSVCVYLDNALLPPIVAGPNDTTVALNNPLSLSVTATGSGTFTYAWYKGTVSAGSLVAGAAGTRNPLVIASVQVGDSGSYICVVGNGNGLDTSRAAHVTVLGGKPVITVEPKDTAISQGTAGRIFVTASGTGTLTYAWYKGPVGAGTLLTGQTGTAFPIAAAKASDSGTYYCIVTNIVGSDTSRGAHLSVTSGAPVITTEPNADTLVLAGGRFKFTVLATGVGTLTYQWYKGTLSSPIATQTANSILYSSAQPLDSGNYICVVKNLYGADTSRPAHLTVVPNPAVSNPVVVRGIFVDSTHVKLTISRYMQLPAAAAPPFPWYVTNLAVWYRANAWPDTSASRLTFSVSQLQTKASDQYDTLVTVSRAATAAPFDRYDFLGSVYWKNTNTAIKDSLPALSDSTSGVSIPMSDQTVIQNPLNMTFVYTTGSDSVRVTLANFSVFTEADWTRIGSLSVSYSVAGGAAVTEDILKSTVQASLVSGTSFSKTYKDQRFTGAEKTVTWQVKLKGVGGNESPVDTASLSVGIPTITNTVKLTADSATSTRIHLSWTANSAPIDTIRIWYGLNPVPAGTVDNLSATDYSVIGLNSAAASTWIGGLNEQTTYFFGLQVGKGGGWSAVTDLSSPHATTTTAPHDSLPNRLKLVSVTFDTATNSLIFSGHIDTSGMRLGSSLDAGIVWAKVSADSFARPDVPATSTVTTILDNANWRFTLPVVPPVLQFNTDYPFGIWIRKTTGGSWSKPTDSSSKVFHIPTPSWQKVTLFATGETSVPVFGGNVVFQKDTNDQFLGITTVRRVQLPLASSGCIPVSAAFGFDNHLSPLFFTIVMHYDSLPATYAPSDIRLYHYDVVRNAWLIDTLAFTLDETQRTVSVRALGSVSAYPFVLAIDTAAPVVSIKSDTSSALPPGSDIPVQWTIHDNIANVKSTLKYGRGDRGLDSLHFYANSTDTLMNYKLSASGDLVIEDQGVRMLLTVTDGRSSKTDTLSRDVARSHSDAQIPDTGVWIPLKATAVLDKPQVENALSGFAVNGALNYDTKKLRLFRWSPAINDWDQYSSDKGAEFTFSPGGVIWLKTRDNSPIDLGTGRTVSLKSPLPITLPANSWTDISVPYNFDVRIGDVLIATGLSAADENSIEFCEWRINQKDSRYHAEQVYQSSIPTLTDQKTVLAGSAGKVYTIHNGLSKDVVLQIPPTPPIAGLSQVAKRQVQQKGWSVAVRPSSAEGALSSVYCGYLEGLSRGGSLSFPMAPSFSKVSVGVYDAKNNSTYGSFVTGQQQGSGYAYQLVFANAQDANAVVNFSVERSAGIPEGMHVALIDPSLGTATSAEKGALSVSVAAGSRAYRWLAVGSVEFTEGFGKTLDRGAFDLLRSGPNPFRGMLRIHYMLPASGIESVRCEVVDQRGRIVWTTREGNSIHPGRNEIVWTPRRIAAGAYILRLSGFDGKGRPVSQKQIRVMYLP